MTHSAPPADTTTTRNATQRRITDVFETIRSRPAPGPLFALAALGAVAAAALLSIPMIDHHTPKRPPRLTVCCTPLSQENCAC